MRRLLPLALLFVLLLMAGCSRSRRPPVPPPQFDDVVEFLAPGGIAEPARLSALSKKRARALLLEAQPAASGRRATNVAYLLMLLRHDSKKNRERLLQAMQSCWQGPAAGCDPGAAGYLATLAERGDTRVTRHLLDAAALAPAELAAPLGEFYGARLLDDPRGFLASIRKRPPEEQRKIAVLAAAAPRRGSSGGLSLAMRRDVQRDLEAILKRKREKLKPLARIFLDALQGHNPAAGR
jgi:hypothetical protein